MTYHIMVDLETLGTGQDAAILIIGACKFDIRDGEPAHHGTFEVRIEWEDAFIRRRVDAATVQWWLQQEEDARQVLVNPSYAVTTKEALVQLAEFIDGDYQPVWSNGATFDIAILENAYAQFDMMPPWKYNSPRDVRTLVHLAEDVVRREDFPFEGTPHNALHDALHQAKYVSAMWMALKGMA